MLCDYIPYCACVADDVTFEPPFLARDVGQQFTVGTGRDAVDSVVAAHEVVGSSLNTRLELW